MNVLTTEGCFPLNNKPPKKLSAENGGKEYKELILVQ
jgi:hypothetical protein